MTKTASLRTWTCLASLFCSLSLFDSLYQLGGSAASYAGMGSGAARELSQVAARMGVGDSVIAAPAATKTAIASPAPRAEKEYGWSDVGRWTQSTGQPVKTIEAVSKQFGWGNQPLPAIRRALRDAEEPTIFYAVDVVMVGNRFEYVAYRKEGERTVAWRVRGFSEIVQTIEWGKDYIITVPNDRYRELSEVVRATMSLRMTQPDPGPATRAGA